MTRSRVRTRPAAGALRAVVWSVLAPALLLGVIAMHAMVSTPAAHAEHQVADHAMVEPADPAATHQFAAAPTTEGGSADLGCGALMVMCLAVLLTVALLLRTGPVRRRLGRGRLLRDARAFQRRSPFAVMPVLATTSICRC